MTNTTSTKSLSAAYLHGWKLRERAANRLKEWSDLEVEVNGLYLRHVVKEGLGSYWLYPHKADCICSGCRPTYCD